MPLQRSGSSVGPVLPNGSFYSNKVAAAEDMMSADSVNSNSPEDGSSNNRVRSDSSSRLHSKGETLKRLKHRARYIPLRLLPGERELLAVVEGALEVSEYTDKVDVSQNDYFARQSYDKEEKVVGCLKELCRLMLGLRTAGDFKSQGRRLLANVELSALRDNEALFRNCLEIGRRHKIMNPDKMRTTYGKLIHILMDAVSPRIKRTLQLKLKTPVKTVAALLGKRRHGLHLLRDRDVLIASCEVRGDTPAEIAAAAKAKADARKRLITRYTVSASSKDRGSGMDETDAHGDDTDPGKASSLPLLDAADIACVLDSIADNRSFLGSNRDPVESLIMYLKETFSPNVVPDNSTFSLAIRHGKHGSKLTHSHATQYRFALQSLTLWAEIMDNFFELWCLAEEDLLDERNGYRLCNTGQGLQRCQSAPRVSRAMQDILGNVRRRVGDWVGLSVVHLGDRDVPNALTFIDKYTQVPASCD